MKSSRVSRSIRPPQMGQKSVGNPSISVILFILNPQFIIVLFYYNKLLIMKNFLLSTIFINFYHFENHILHYHILWMVQKSIILDQYQFINLLSIKDIVFSESQMIQSQISVKFEDPNLIKVEHYSCAQGKPAFRVCANKNCLNPSICCKDSDCQCYQKHLDCPQLHLQNLVKKLYSKLTNSTQILNKAAKFFDNIIDRVSQISEQTQKIIKRYGLREDEINFLQYFEQNRETKLCGKIVYEANQLSAKKYNGDFEQIQKCVDKLWNQMDGIFWGIFYSTKDLYELPLKKSSLSQNSGMGFLADTIQQMKLTMSSIQSIKLDDLKIMQKQLLGLRVKRQQQQVAEDFEKILKMEIKKPNVIQQDVLLKNAYDMLSDKRKRNLQSRNQVKREQLKQQVTLRPPVVNQTNPKNETVLSRIQTSNKEKNPNTYRSPLMNYLLNPFLSSKVNKQAITTLSDLCGISQQEAEKFVKQNGFNLLGSQKTTQQIVNLWFTKNIS